MYSIDTSALLDAWVRWYPPAVFPSVWKFLEDSVANGTIVATEEVRHELQRKEDDLHDWIRRHTSMIVPHDEAIQESVLEILAQFPKLVDERTSKSMADPFVIAVARVRGYAVVTGEKGGSPHRPKIPNVCEHFGVRVMGIVELFRERGWAF
ncbi:DUF4411 family protein [Maioricimonas sp. JC845]|uniref:DUF4411 family protein n=1 Tax=Maioricimonas sp. JC845 TaxID=3232138 RepID=UPI0034598763